MDDKTVGAQMQRHFDTQAGVVDEFANTQAARRRFYQVLKNNGWEKVGSRKYHKDNQPILITPH